jgi:hypothetical protein
MKAGNATYQRAGDIPAVVPVFPLTGALLLPGGQMPLNIFEPRYLAMIDDALCGDRVIGMIQPALQAAKSVSDCREQPSLCSIGCLGRITAFQESGDGRYLINLSGVARYRVISEEAGNRGYRRCRIEPMANDLGEEDETAVDRASLLATFRKYLVANGMEADWDSINRATNGSLVTALCMMSPYGPPEKQALLEAPNLKMRAETLVAITEIMLARDSAANGPGLQ